MVPEGSDATTNFMRVVGSSEILVQGIRYLASVGRVDQCMEVCSVCASMAKKLDKRFNFQGLKKYFLDFFLSEKLTGWCSCCSLSKFVKIDIYSA